MDVFRDITSVLVGTVVMLLALFGVLFVLSSQCFAPANPGSLALRPTSTSAPASGSVREPTVTTDDGPLPTETSMPSPTAEPTSTAAATSTPRPVPSPTAQLTPQPAAPVVANFSGAWRLIDTVTSGTGTGQTFTFDITLVQDGATLSGGSGSLVINGSVEGRTASASFAQPALGITGTFNWTLTPEGGASGSFTSSVPNAGTSVLVLR